MFVSIFADSELMICWILYSVVTRHTSTNTYVWVHVD